MPFFLDTQETSHRFGSYIADFHSILDTNHIRHGSPDDLFDFAKILDSSNQFRNDLSALVKSVMRKDGDQLLLTDMVSIIATAVGGPSFADSHSDITRPTNALMDFLLGTGCWKQFGSPSPAVSQTPAPSPRPPVRAEERRSSEISPAVSPAAPAGATSENPADLVNTSSELRQTLTRLEINTLQVKLHLESIEQRINKIQPSPEALPAQPPLPSPSEPLLHSRSDAEKFERPLATLRAFEAENTSRRAVFSHEPIQPETDDFSSPTFAFAAEGGRNITPIGVFLAIVAIAVAVLLFAHSGPGKGLLNSGMSHLKAAVPSLFGGEAETGDAPTATSPPNPAPSSTSPEATPVPSSPSAATDSGSSTPSAEARFTPANPQARYVQSNVMEGNLLSAPRPAYPSLARSNHVQGTVVLQATISRSGSIRTLHAVKGPEALRGAAVDAVRHWHYKPYTVDGHPVEVATTIYVHFNSGPPPAIAH